MDDVTTYRNKKMAHPEKCICDECRVAMLRAKQQEAKHAAVTK